MDRPLIQLHRRQPESCVAIGESKHFDWIARTVHRDRVIVRINGTNVVGKCADPFGPEVEVQVVFLTEVPFQRQ